jgi:hypothetical protein
MVAPVGYAASFTFRRFLHISMSSATSRLGAEWVIQPEEA